MVNEITLWVCDKCDTHPATFCHECFGCGEYMKPVEFVRRPTPLAADGLTICQNCGSWLRAGECENCNSPFALAAKA